MIIEKNKVAYTVSETSNEWTLRASFNKVGVSYNISKADCPTIEELEKFVAESDDI